MSPVKSGGEKRGISIIKSFGRIYKMTSESVLRTDAIFTCLHYSNKVFSMISSNRSRLEKIDRDLERMARFKELMEADVTDTIEYKLLYFRFIVSP